jgi:hypothetical protein
MNLKMMISGAAAVPLAAAALLASPATAAAAPVQLNGFTLSSGCIQPGGSVTATATVQDTAGYPVTFYSQSWVTEGGVEVYRGGVAGPDTAPAFVPVSQSQTLQVPAYTPWGYYTINLGIGPSSSDATSWSQRSATLTVSPYCWFH